MEDLIILVYLLILLNMTVVLFAGYDSCKKNDKHFNANQEVDNMFVRRR
jgi:hypothetical protein